MTARISARRLVNHAGPIVIGKGVQYLGALLFATVVPRLMGPTVYGPFAVYVSLLIVLAMLGDFGTLLIFGRFVPTFRRAGDERKLAWFFGQLSAFKTLAAVPIGLIFVMVGRRVMPDWPLPWLWLGAGTLLLRIAADNCYHLAFGLNRTAQWIARESLRNLVQFVLVWQLFVHFGLQGAAVGLFLTDVCFLLLGLSWTWRYWSWRGLDLRALRPYLRFGAYFFGANICLMAFQRGGSVLLAAWRVPPTEIAYFDLAFNVFLILYGTMTQLVLSAVPTLVSWLAAGRETDVVAMLNLLWKGSALAAAGVACATWLAAEPLVVLAFGEAYLPVTRHLRVVILDLVPLALGQMSFVVASIYRRPAIPLWAGLAMLLSFIGLSAGLIPAWGSLGPAWASLVAMSVYALATGWCIRSLLRMGG